MRELLNDSELREFEILIVLFYEKKWWKIQELSDEIKCSMDTTYKTITKINDFSEANNQGYFIETKRRVGVILHTKSDFSLAYVQALYQYHSIRYKILDHIFQTPNLTLENLSQELYVSKSTVYREVTSIISVLKTTNLDLNISTLKIIGDEALIRHLMLHLYFPILHHIVWPFKTVSQQLIDFRKREFFPELYLSFKQTISLKLSCQLAINFIRHFSQEYICSFSPENVIDPVRKKMVLVVNDIYQKSIPEKYRQNELDYLATLGLLTTHCAEDLSKMTEIVSFHKKKNSLAFSLSDFFVNELSKIYPELDFANSVSFRFKLLSFATYAITYPGLKFDPTNIKKTIDHFRNEAPSIMNNIIKICETIYLQPKFFKRLININDSIVELYFIVSESFEIETLERPILIKISSTHPVYEATMKRTLLKRSCLNLDVHTSQSPIEKELLFDLVISDVKQLEKSDLKSKHSYTWSYPPSIRDWERIDALLDELAKG